MSRQLHSFQYAIWFHFILLVCAILNSQVMPISQDVFEDQLALFDEAGDIGNIKDRTHNVINDGINTMQSETHDDRKPTEASEGDQIQRSSSLVGDNDIGIKGDTRSSDDINEYVEKESVTKLEDDDDTIEDSPPLPPPQQSQIPELPRMVICYCSNTSIPTFSFLCWVVL